MLLAVPNVSEGRDPVMIAGLAEAFMASGDVHLLDTHSDPDHNRSVFTLAGSPEPLVAALLTGARAVVERIDISRWIGPHPAIGALDVCPLVEPNGAPSQETLSAARALGADLAATLALPTFLYGELAADPERAERSYFRRGGPVHLSDRMRSGALHPDFGPPVPHSTAGAVLVTARGPLGAFNVELDTGGAAVARAVAAKLRESGGGPAGVRAIGLLLSSGRAQISTNIADPFAVPLATVIDRVRELAADHGARVVGAELVGLIPEAALVGYPSDVPIRDFDPELRIVERRLASL